MKNQGKFALIFMVSTLASACSSGNGVWPNLSDPLPAPEERTREPEPLKTADVIPGVKPPAPQRPGMTGAVTPAPVAPPRPTTEAEASDLLEAIKKALREETLSYRETKAKLATAEGQESQEDAWFAAQLALTRLSRTASRLDDFKTLEIPTIANAAIAESDIIDRFVVGERQFLMEAQPQTTVQE